MTTLLKNRQSKGTSEGGQFATATHSEPAVRLAADASQTFLYDAATTGPEAGRAEAARAAISSCREAFEDLTAEGAEDLVEERSKDDEKLIRAIDSLGELDVDEQHYFGKHLAEQLHEDCYEDEQNYWASRYASERALDLEPIPDDAYESNDPKHPGYAERLGL